MKTLEELLKEIEYKGYLKVWPVTDLEDNWRKLYNITFVFNNVNNDKFTIELKNQSSIKESLKSILNSVSKFENELRTA
jgi:hypothetical protein